MKSYLATHSPVPAILESPEAIRARCAHRPGQPPKKPSKSKFLYSTQIAC